jgi:hypothetical protein
VGLARITVRIGLPLQAGRACTRPSEGARRALRTGILAGLTISWSDSQIEPRKSGAFHVEHPSGSPHATLNPGFEARGASSGSLGIAIRWSDSSDRADPRGPRSFGSTISWSDSQRCLALPRQLRCSGLTICWSDSQRCPVPPRQLRCSGLTICWSDSQTKPAARCQLRCSGLIIYWSDSQTKPAARCQLRCSGLIICWSDSQTAPHRTASSGAGA